MGLSEELTAVYWGKRVLVTGHTGFKGSWLTLWLSDLGAEVTGFALAPQRPGLFEDLELSDSCRHIVADIRDLDGLRRVFRATEPDVVFHLAAQALVTRSYASPLETLETNVLGTGHVLEAARLEPRRRAIVIITSDKCYEKQETGPGYREDDRLGGHDPYSMSKGAAELVVASYRRSFFPVARLAEHGVAVASARAGNVVGGGDWALDRLVPDAMRALSVRRPVGVRNPDAIRPWQHVLEPLAGYLTLGMRLMGNEPAGFCEAWNFGPPEANARTVREVVEQVIAAWGEGTWEPVPGRPEVQEASVLRLNTEKARSRLGWMPRWDFIQTIQATVAWHRARHAHASRDDLRALCRSQIRAYSDASPVEGGRT